MPIHPRGSAIVTITKSPRYGNRDTFSNGEKSVKIKAWTVWNSAYRRQVSPQSRVYNDETTLVVRTHNPLAEELQTDDSLEMDGYSYSVQQVHAVETALGVNTQDIEISLK